MAIFSSSISSWDYQRRASKLLGKNMKAKRFPKRVRNLAKQRRQNLEIPYQLAGQVYALYADSSRGYAAWFTRYR